MLKEGESFRVLNQRTILRYGRTKYKEYEVDNTVGVRTIFE